MRILAVCFAILTFGRTAVASDVQVGDHVLTISGGIACSEWTSFEALRNSDPQMQKGKLPAGCRMVVTPPPPLFIVDAVKESADAVCVRPDNWPPPCFWFSLGKVRTLLAAGQIKI
jgi:hypothetical protein